MTTFKQVLLEIRRFSNLGLHDSAVLLGSFAVNLSEPGQSRALALVAWGHALREDGQNKRALQVYNEALHEISRFESTNISSLGEEFSIIEDDENDATQDELNEDPSVFFDQKKRPRRANAIRSVGSFVAMIKFRMAQCHCVKYINLPF